MLPKPLDLTKQLITPFITQGSHVVDATVGNGHDTLFLLESLESVGGGTLTGVDLQAEAISATRERLEAISSTSTINLIQQCHSEIDYTELSPPTVIMFNLGYLPKFDKTVITQPHTSLLAIQKACQHLAVGGVISIMGYLGHEGGSEECTLIETHLKTLSRKNYRVLTYQYLNAPNTPPYLILVEKVS